MLPFPRFLAVLSACALGLSANGQEKPAHEEAAKKPEGEKKEEKRAKHLAEIVYGRIYRAYLLPKDAKKEGIEARLAKGVLEVRIPREKRPEEPPVRIPIQES